MDGKSCVVCGEAAVADVAEKTGRELPVCAAHVVSGYRVELHLAIEGLKSAALDEMGRSFRWTARWKFWD